MILVLLPHADTDDIRCFDVLERETQSKFRSLIALAFSVGRQHLEGDAWFVCVLNELDHSFAIFLIKDLMLAINRLSTRMTVDCIKRRLIEIDVPILRSDFLCDVRQMGTNTDKQTGIAQTFHPLSHKV